MRKRKVAAIMMTSALLGTTIFSGDIGLETVATLNAEELHETQQEDGIQKLLEKSEGTSDGEALPEEDASEVYHDEQVDYDYIINEAKQKDYRENVEIAKDTVLIISTEDEEEVRASDWYGQIGATEIEKIAEKDDKTYTYEITVGAEDIWSVVDALNQKEEVLMAEPDYIYRIQTDGVPDETSDPDISKEWYLDDLQVDTIWESLTEEGKGIGNDVVVAVIDTGVDYTHQDLVDNMWVNTAELTGSAGVDDDGNGYVDDIYGISLIDNSGNPADDHGHGTHVAGIVAMAEGNGGGAGIAYQSKIMAVKAGQADGSFASSDIAKAIKYAAANGADVINMSFGGYGHSAIVEEALQDAFGKCVLIAAAGNDNYPTLDASPAFYLKGNMYPAAYTYVVGVMACDQSGLLADFSNWDYKSNYGAEYEIAAPGKNIYSTLPGNRYASWSGTSMAAPMVSAAAALLRSQYSDKASYSSRFIMGQLVSATEDELLYVDKEGAKHFYAKLNIIDSMTNKPKPNISVQEVYLFDSPEISEVNNGDGIVQAGETIDMGIILKNQWGAATELKAVVSSTSVGGVDNPYVSFLTDKSVPMQDIGTFSTQDNGLIKDEEGAIVGVENPVRFKVAENAPNDASVTLTVNYTAKNQMDDQDTTLYTLPEEMAYRYHFTIQKGKVLKGKISADMTLTSDQYWIIENSVLIPRGVTVDVEPGTQIQFWSSDSNSVYAEQNMAYIQVEGTLNIKGTQEKPVSLFPGKGYESFAVDLRRAGTGKIYMEYAEIVNPKIDITTGDHLRICQDTDYISYRGVWSGTIGLNTMGGYVHADNISNSIIKNVRTPYYWGGADVRFEADNVLFDNCYCDFYQIKSKNSVYLVNAARDEDYNSGMLQYGISKMHNAGYRFYIPQYQISNIYQCNGYKYAVMGFDSNSYYLGWDHPLENYQLLTQTIQNNGGMLGEINIDNFEIVDQIAKDEIVQEWIGDNDENGYFGMMTSWHYNDQMQAMVNENNEPLEYKNYYSSDLYTNNARKYGYFYTYLRQGKISYYNYSTETYDEVYQHHSYINSSIDNKVLVKYPDSVPDEKIKNVYFGIEDIDLSQFQSFTNNAILNRLAIPDVDQWMRFLTDDSNSYLYNVTNNYWGTESEKLINSQIYDFDDNISVADYIDAPYLTSGNEQMYPFVTEVYIADKNGERVDTVGNGTYQVHVLFNRDMDTSVSPYVTYGPDDPYTDYVVEGAFVNPREWVGETTINVIINQGTQIFRVKDAQAAEDAWLTTGTDWGRFTFSIEAAGAEALTLHGEGGENQVSLNWVQDDYETLAGYNLYRSEYYNKDDVYSLNNFRKINATVIGAGTCEYVDRDVLPGVQYYYYFKVVDTAMNESKASNVIECKPTDNVLPVITHDIITGARAGLGLSVTAQVTDNIGVEYVKVYYREKNTDNWSSMNLVNTDNGSNYFVSVPASELKLGEMEYYLEAYDGTTSAYVGSKENPYTFTVEQVTIITAVSPDTLDVSESGQTGTVTGMFLTEDMQVYVDDVAVDTQYVSDKKLTFTLPALSMGQKTVSLWRDGVQVAKYENAIKYSDKSIMVTTDEIVGLEGNYVGTIIKTNYTDVIYNMEITVTENISCSVSGDTKVKSEGRWTEDAGWVYKHSFQFANGVNSINGVNDLPYLYFSLYKNNRYQMLEVKINGVEVQNVSMGEITVYTQEDLKKVENITVMKDNLPLEKNEIKLTVGDTIKLDAVVTPADATISAVQWYSNYGGVTVESDGSITATGEGEGYIYCRAIDGSDIQKEIHFVVKGLALEDIQLEKQEITLLSGELLDVSWMLFPWNASHSNLTYSSSNWEIAELRSFYQWENTMCIRAKEVGTATISVYDYENPTVKAQITVKVIPNEAYIDLNENIIALSEGESHQVSAVVKNVQNDSNLSYTWHSSDTKVARVSEGGQVTYVGDGTAVITATLDSNGNEDSFIVLCGKEDSNSQVGDVNDDGIINVKDAMLVLQLVTSAKLNKEFIRRADVNGDSGVSSLDAMMILQYATGKINSFEKN